MEFLKLSSIKIITATLFLISLTACSLFEPFIDRRRNAGVRDIRRLYVGKSKPEAPAVCYNGLWTTEDELQQLADAECVKNNTGTHAEKINTTHFSCKLVLPSHAYFKCVK